MHNVIRIQAVVFLVIGLGFMVWISTLAYTRAQIQGLVPGLKLQTYAVTQKLYEPRRSLKVGEQYWIGWTNQNIQYDGPHRASIGAQLWNSLQVGSKIVIATGVDGMPHLYTKSLAQEEALMPVALLLIPDIAFCLWMIAVIAKTKAKPREAWERY